MEERIRLKVNINRPSGYSGLDRVTFALRVVKFLVAVIFFAAIFFAFLNINLWDYDFWWHIATGRYIVETGTIPDSDPFSFTSNISENRNLFPGWKKSVLKQYWLSQVLFYMLYDYAGPKGIIVLRSALLVLTLIIVFWRLKRWSVSFPISFAFTFILFTILLKATGERPVLFTIFFTALTFFILEDFRDKKDKRIFLLPPIMLFWANLHGGFILGAAIIMVFMLVNGFEIVLRKKMFSKDKIILFYIATVSALGVSFINPTGWDAFSFALSPKYKPFTEGVYEYYSPFLLYKYHVMPIHYGYVFLMAIFPLILALRNKRFDMTRIVLAAGTLIMSISAMRFVVYYGIIGAMVLGKELDALIEDLIKKRFTEGTYYKIFNMLTLVVLLSAILFSTGYLTKNISFDIARYYSVPAGAVDFIEKNRIKGNMFNDMGYGGYLTWRLYPWGKTFLDARAVNFAVRLEAGWIEGGVDFIEGVPQSINKRPLWEKLLNHYKINFVIVPILNIYGEVPPIVFKLSQGDDWVPVYCDIVSIIFVRNTEQNKDMVKKFRLSKDNVYSKIIYAASAAAMFDKRNPRYLTTIGEAFYKMGRLQNALKAYNYALNRMSGNPKIFERLRQIEAEIKNNSEKDKQE